jgi:hypothetical protein
MTSFVLNIDEASKLGKSVLKFLKELEGNELSLSGLNEYVEQAEDAALGEIMLSEKTGEYVNEDDILKKLM